MSDLEDRVAKIEERNQRVAIDKGWEISFTRRASIAVLTYVCAFVFLNIVGHEGAWKHAFIPVLGYVVSTLSLPFIKDAWINYKLDRKL